MVGNGAYTERPPPALHVDKKFLILLSQPYSQITQSSGECGRPEFPWRIRSSVHTLAGMHPTFTLCKINGWTYRYIRSLTCKSRKLKCDETKPCCRHCVKASRNCNYGNVNIFRGQAIHSTPRHKRRGRGKSNVLEEDSHIVEEGNTWLEIPSECKSTN